MITSRQHPVVKTFRAVARGDATRALLDGWHLLHEAVASGMKVETVAVASAPNASDRALLERLSRDTEIIEVASSVMDALSPVRTPTGVAAVITRPSVEMTRVTQPTPALVVVAIDVQDPGNIGAMIRSAEAGGATGVVLAGASADPWGWKALRASMGSTFRLPVVRTTDSQHACAQLRDAGLRLVATVPRDGDSMHAADLLEATAILLGGEGPGLSPALLDRADARVSIPMSAAVESLNVAVAAALLVYEARRQREGRRR